MPEPVPQQFEREVVGAVDAAVVCKGAEPDKIGAIGAHGVRAEAALGHEVLGELVDRGGEPHLHRLDIGSGHSGELVRERLESRVRGHRGELLEEFAAETGHLREFPHRYDAMHDLVVVDAGDGE